MARPTKLTPELEESIVLLIRDGVYPWVAAEANGITGATFRNWMVKGEKATAGPYREFFYKVRSAQAYARTKAERAVHRNNPFAWLRYGPGRERDGEPGWTEESKQQQSGEVLVRVEYVDADANDTAP